MRLFRLLRNLVQRLTKAPPIYAQAPPRPVRRTPNAPRQHIAVGQSEHAWKGVELQEYVVRIGHAEVGTHEASGTLAWFFERTLAFKGESLRDVAAFLASCRYINDTEQFKRPDWWIHPVEFEELKRGDCEDHALWAWRVLHDLGHDVRFMIGLCRGEGHAWVQMYTDDGSFLLEATAKHDVPADVVSDYLPEFSFKRAADGSFMMFGHNPGTSEHAGRTPVDPPPSSEEWVEIDRLIFACKKTEAHRAIRIAMQGKGSYTRQFLDRYFYLREHHPDSFGLDDEAYWADWAG